VVLGTTMAFMGITYFLIPVLFRREMAFPGVAKWQPYVYGLGMTMLALFMMGAGTLGVPRRHWDISFSGNPLAFEFPGIAWLMIGLMAIGGLIAIVGGGMFLLVTVYSVFLGKKIETPGFQLVRAKDGVAAAPAAPVAASLSGTGSVAHASSAAGTFTLALVFLVAFVLYYFINWKYLSTVWPLR
jgi:cytochrome c oxidase subunit 1